MHGTFDPADQTQQLMYVASTGEQHGPPWLGLPVTTSREHRHSFARRLQNRESYCDYGIIAGCTAGGMRILTHGPFSMNSALPLQQRRKQAYRVGISGVL